MDSESGQRPSKAERYCAGEGERGGSDSRSEYKFPSHERLRKPVEFKEVISKGVVIDRGIYRAHLLILPGEARKVGFVVGRSVGHACKRNRARRLLREAYRRLRPRLAVGGFRVVFVAKEPVVNLKSTQIMADMATVFEQHGLTRR